MQKAGVESATNPTPYPCHTCQPMPPSIIRLLHIGFPHGSSLATRHYQGLIGGAMWIRETARNRVALYSLAETSTH